MSVGQTSKTCLNPAALPPPTGSPGTPFYSWVVRKGGVVAFSGMLGYTRDKQLAGDDIARQARQAMLNLRDAVTAAGGTLADVVTTTVYVVATDLQQDVYPQLNPVFGEFFPADPPARAVIGVTALPRPADLVEIVATAVIDAP